MTSGPIYERGTIVRYKGERCVVIDWYFSLIRVRRPDGTETAPIHASDVELIERHRPYARKGATP